MPTLLRRMFAAVLCGSILVTVPGLPAWGAVARVVTALPSPAAVPPAARPTALCVLPPALTLPSVGIISQISVVPVAAPAATAASEAESVLEGGPVPQRLQTLAGPETSAGGEDAAAQSSESSRRFDGTAESRAASIGEAPVAPLAAGPSRVQALAPLGLQSASGPRNGLPPPASASLVERLPRASFRAVFNPYLISIVAVTGWNALSLGAAALAAPLIAGPLTPWIVGGTVLALLAGTSVVMDMSASPAVQRSLPLAVLASLPFLIGLGTAASSIGMTGLPFLFVALSFMGLVVPMDIAPQLAWQRWGLLPPKVLSAALAAARGLSLDPVQAKWVKALLSTRSARDKAFREMRLDPARARILLPVLDQILDADEYEILTPILGLLETWLDEESMSLLAALKKYYTGKKDKEGMLALVEESLARAREMRADLEKMEGSSTAAPLGVQRILARAQAAVKALASDASLPAKLKRQALTEAIAELEAALASQDQRAQASASQRIDDLLSQASAQAPPASAASLFSRQFFSGIASNPAFLTGAAFLALNVAVLGAGLFFLPFLSKYAGLLFIGLVLSLFLKSDRLSVWPRRLLALASFVFFDLTAEILFMKLPAGADRIIFVGASLALYAGLMLSARSLLPPAVASGVFQAEEIPLHPLLRKAAFDAAKGLSLTSRQKTWLRGLLSKEARRKGVLDELRAAPQEARPLLPVLAVLLPDFVKTQWSGWDGSDVLETFLAVSEALADEQAVGFLSALEERYKISLPGKYAEVHGALMRVRESRASIDRIETIAALARKTEAAPFSEILAQAEVVAALLAGDAALPARIKKKAIQDAAAELKASTGNARAMAAQRLENLLRNSPAAPPASAANLFSRHPLSRVFFHPILLPLATILAFNVAVFGAGYLVLPWLVKHGGVVLAGLIVSIILSNGKTATLQRRLAALGIFVLFDLAVEVACALPFGVPGIFIAFAAMTYLYAGIVSSPRGPGFAQSMFDLLPSPLRRAAFKAARGLSLTPRQREWFYGLLSTGKSRRKVLDELRLNPGEARALLPVLRALLPGVGSTQLSAGDVGEILQTLLAVYEAAPDDEAVGSLQELEASYNFVEPGRHAMVHETLLRVQDARAAIDRIEELAALARKTEADPFSELLARAESAVTALGRDASLPARVKSRAILEAASELSTKTADAQAAAAKRLDDLLKDASAPPASSQLLPPPAAVDGLSLDYPGKRDAQFFGFFLGGFILFPFLVAQGSKVGLAVGAVLFGLYIAYHAYWIFVSPLLGKFLPSLRAALGGHSPRLLSRFYARRTWALEELGRDPSQWTPETAELLHQLAVHEPAIEPFERAVRLLGRMSTPEALAALKDIDERSRRRPFEFVGTRDRALAAIRDAWAQSQPRLEPPFPISPTATGPEELLDRARAAAKTLALDPVLPDKLKLQALKEAMAELEAKIAANNPEAQAFAAQRLEDLLKDAPPAAVPLANLIPVSRAGVSLYRGAHSPSLGTWVGIGLVVGLIDALINGYLLFGLGMGAALVSLVARGIWKIVTGPLNSDDQEALQIEWTRLAAKGPAWAGLREELLAAKDETRLEGIEKLSNSPELWDEDLVSILHLLAVYETSRYNFEEIVDLLGRIASPEARRALKDLHLRLRRTVMTPPKRNDLLEAVAEAMSEAKVAARERRGEATLSKLAEAKPADPPGLLERAQAAVDLLAEDSALPSQVRRAAILEALQALKGILASGGDNIVAAQRLEDLLKDAPPVAAPVQRLQAAPVVKSNPNRGLGRRAPPSFVAPLALIFLATTLGLSVLVPIVIPVFPFELMVVYVPLIGVFSTLVGYGIIKERHFNRLIKGPLDKKDVVVLKALYREIEARRNPAWGRLVPGLLAATSQERYKTLQELEAEAENHPDPDLVSFLVNLARAEVSPLDLTGIFACLYGMKTPESWKALEGFAKEDIDSGSRLYLDIVLRLIAQGPKPSQGAVQDVLDAALPREELLAKSMLVRLALSQDGSLPSKIRSRAIEAAEQELQKAADGQDPNAKAFAAQRLEDLLKDVSLAEAPALSLLGRGDAPAGPRLPFGLSARLKATWAMTAVPAVLNIVLAVGLSLALMAALSSPLTALAGGVAWGRVIFKEMSRELPPVLRAVPKAVTAFDWPVKHSLDRLMARLQLDAAKTPKTALDEILSPFERIPGYNAFSYGAGVGPDAVIAVGEKWVDARPDVLDALVAHELGHLWYRAIAAQWKLEKLQRLSLAAIVAVFLCSLFMPALFGWGAVTPLAVSLTLGVVNMFSAFAYKRSQEFQADLFAARAVGHPAVRALLEVLASQTMGLRRGVDGLFASHPSASQRIRSIERDESRR